MIFHYFACCCFLPPFIPVFESTHIGVCPVWSRHCHCHSCSWSILCVPPPATAPAYAYGFLHVRVPPGYAQPRSAGRLMSRSHTQPMRDRSFREITSLPFQFPCVPHHLSECLVELTPTSPNPQSPVFLAVLPAIAKQLLNPCLRVFVAENPDLDAVCMCEYGCTCILVHEHAGIKV